MPSSSCRLLSCSFSVRAQLAQVPQDLYNGQAGKIPLFRHACRDGGKIDAGVFRRIGIHQAVAHKQCVALFSLKEIECLKNALRIRLRRATSSPPTTRSILSAMPYRSSVSMILYRYFVEMTAILQSFSFRHRIMGRTVSYRTVRCTITSSALFTYSLRQSSRVSSSSFPVRSLKESTSVSPIVRLIASSVIPPYRCFFRTKR